MFCEINGKYYVKVSNFFQELEVVNNDIVPTKGESKRLYAPVSECKKVTPEEILKNKRKKFSKSNEEIF